MATQDKPYTGRAGGLVGGPARAKKLSPKRRREIASMGGKAAKENRLRKLLTVAEQGTILENSK